MMLFYACDRPYDNQSDDYERALIAAAIATKTELRDWLPPEFVTDEGLYATRYLIEVASHEQLEEFLINIPNTLIKGDWLLISEESYTEQVTFLGEKRLTLQEPQNIIKVEGPIPQDGSIVKFNRRLKEKLSKTPALYFTYEWIVPMLISPNSLNTDLTKFQRWDEIFRQSKLYEPAKACDNLRIAGCSLRGAEAYKRRDLFVQQLVVRVFSIDELELVAQVTGFPKAEWFSVPASSYWNGTCISENHPYNKSFQTFFLRLQEMGQANEQTQQGRYG